MAVIWGGSILTAPRTFSDDTETQVKNAASDASTGIKKDVRSGKKTARQAAGEDSAAKDAKDTVSNAKDDAENAAQKAKNKTG
jgi:hypothetical protein